MTAAIPRRMHVSRGHPAFCPHANQFGVRVDGEELTDVHFYDLDTKQYQRRAGRVTRAQTLEVFDRGHPESRQVRRARERWERSKKLVPAD